ncbi:transcriptional regulator, IclR family [Rhodococcus wratislaviensis]|uniref:Transcriptional regulator, IclR family n=1 Tax=Rhodococcus wratislaviensis TaxID=44752 RepID=A0A402CC42_RHOWR|nr:IclR family transcriptional regulator [Rhodococcus wratislaviensis]GCE41205.1 transcriptional regulator, IclR family [Rhodococcus wratislaviensis]
MKTRPISKPTYMIESVHNALLLLNAVRDHGSLRLKDAAEEIGVAESTAHRLLAMLIYHGFVVQDESRRYLPGPSIGVGPTGSSWTRTFRDACLDSMHELASLTGETVNLVVRTGVESRVIGAVESEKLLRVGNRQGHVPPARTSAGGRVLLAQLDDSALADLYRSEYALSADRLTPAEFALLQKELRVVSERGYATAVDAVEVGLSSVAVCLRNGEGVALGALVVAMPTTRFHASLESGLVSQMRRTAAGIESRIRDLRSSDAA